MPDDVIWDSLKNDPGLIQLQDLGQEVMQLSASAKLDKTQYPGLDDPDWLNRVFLRVSSTFTLIVIGQVSSGKSSFVNSLFGERLLLPADQPTDGVVSVLLSAEDDGPEYAEKELDDGSVVAFDSIEEATKFLRQQETPSDEQLKCREVRIYLHNPLLRHLRIVNTPGLGDRLQAFEKTALMYLHEDESDLVVWTFFPETAANDAEVSVFARALSRRHKDVLGIVTRCFEGHEDDEGYDPRTDVAFSGEGGVISWLQKNLNAYLSEIILYDSHRVRRLVQRMNNEPELMSDPDFIQKLERAGYAQFERLLGELVGPQGEGVKESRISSLFRRCSGHATDLAKAAEAAEAELLRMTESEEEQIAAWKQVEQDVIGPFRLLLKDEVRTSAQKHAKELVELMGDSAADAIKENFRFFETLGRSLSSWAIGRVDSASEALNKKIQKSVMDSIAETRFYENLEETMKNLINERLLILKSDLSQILEAKEARNIGNVGLTVVAGRPAGGTEDILGDVLTEAFNRVIGEIIKSTAKTISAHDTAEIIEKAAEKAAAEATKNIRDKAVIQTVKQAATQAAAQAATQATEETVQQAAIKAATQATEQAAQQAVQKTAQQAVQQSTKQVAKKSLITFSRAANFASLLFAALDINKIAKDFRTGKDNLADLVQKRYEEASTNYEERIFNIFWNKADKKLQAALQDARANLEDHDAERAKLLESVQKAASYRESLDDLAQLFTARANA